MILEIFKCLFPSTIDEDIDKITNQLDKGIKYKYNTRYKLGLVLTVFNIHGEIIS